MIDVYNILLIHIEEMWRKLVISGNQKIPFECNHWTPIVYFQGNHLVSDQLTPLSFLDFISFLAEQFISISYIDQDLSGLKYYHF